MASKLKITLVKSPIGQRPAVRATVRSLGLGKINSQVIANNNASIAGMVKTVQHLVTVEELD